MYRTSNVQYKQDFVSPPKETNRALLQGSMYKGALGTMVADTREIHKPILAIAGNRSMIK
jgi:hypothetical protein